MLSKRNVDGNGIFKRCKTYLISRLNAHIIAKHKLEEENKMLKRIISIHPTYVLCTLKIQAPAIGLFDGCAIIVVLKKKNRSCINYHLFTIQVSHHRNIYTYHMYMKKYLKKVFLV